MGVLSSLGSSIGGSALGSAVVQLGLDMSGLQRGLAQARGEVQASTTTMGKATGALSAGVVAFAAVGGAAVLAFGASSVKAFTESQNVMAQTEAVLKSTGGAAGVTATEVTTLAGKMQELTTFSDEEVQSAENLLLTFTNIGQEIFPQTTQAVLDMSTALGQDLKSSAIQLGKALNDPLVGLTALRRVGVAFSKEQVAQIQTLVEHNKLLAAQKIVLAEVAKEFGGSAAAAARTFSGRIAQLGNAFNDLQESIGKALVTVLSPLLPLFTGFVKVLTPLVPSLLAAGAAFGVMALTMKVLPTALLGLAHALQAVGLKAAGAAVGGKAFALAYAGIGPVIAAFAAIGVGAFLLISRAIEAHKAEIDALALSYVRLGEDQAKQAAFEAKIKADSPPSRFGAYIDERKIQEVTERAAELAKQFGEATASVIAHNKQLAVTGEIAQSAAPSIKLMGTTVREFADAANQAGRAGSAAFQKFSQETLAKAEQAFADWRVATSESISGVGGVLSDLADRTNLTVGKISTSFQRAARAARVFGQDLRTIATTGGAAGEELARQLLELGPAAAGLASKIAGASGKARARMVSDFGAILGAGDKAAAGLQNVMVGTLEDIKSILSAIAKKWNVDVSVDAGQAESTLERLRQDVFALTSGTHTVVINTQVTGAGARQLASGGIIGAQRGLIASRPTMLVGEGSYPTFAGRGAEAVIPLNTRGIDILAEAVRRGTSGGGRTINVYVQNAFGADLDRVITDSLSRSMLRRS